MTTTSSLIRTGTNGGRARRIGIVVIASFALAACSGSDDESASRTSAGEVAVPAAPAAAVDPTTPATEAAGVERVPDGIYRRVVTAADGEVLGIDPAFVTGFLGPDGEMPLGLRIDGDGFEILVTNDAGIEEVGDVGSVGYGDDGSLEIVDSLGGLLTVEWTYRDGLLSTRIGEGDAPDTTLVWTGEWMLDGVATEVVDALRIPDGTYRRVATAADADDLGVDPEIVADFIGDDGELPLALRFDGASLQLLVTNDAGVEEVGVVATVEYDDDGRLLAHEACCGDSILEWTYADGVLVTDLIADAEGSPAHPVGQLHLTGEWMLEGSAPSGEAAGDVVTLTFANPLMDLPPQIISFASEARNAADQAIEWNVDQQAGTEAEIIASVLAGDVDIAWVGARAFPEFDALLAPMLVDSYELQTAVFEQGIVDRLSDTLAERGLMALAVYPGPLRRIVGVARPIASAADFEGREIGIGFLDPPPLQVETIEALGAVRGTIGEGTDIAELDGFEAHLGAVTGNSWENEVASVTANLNLWPRPLVVFTTVERFEQLDPSTREALVAGGVAAFDAAAAATLGDDDVALDGLCRATAELVELSSADLAEIRERLEPVYASLTSTPTTADVIAEIEALKADLAIPPTLATCEGR